MGPEDTLPAFREKLKTAPHRKAECLFLWAVWSPASSKRLQSHSLRGPAVLSCVCLWARFLPTAAVEDWIPGWGSWPLLPYPHSLPQCLVLKWQTRVYWKGEGKTICLVFFLLFWLHHAANGFLVPWPRIEPVPCAVKTESLNHWTAREVPFSFLFCFVLSREEQSY